jgi:xylan 1,4-beta-xylosidase
VLVWHYHDDDVPGPEANVELSLTGLSLPDGTVQAQQFRIDADHSNSYGAWKRMGEPMQPSAEQYTILEAAGKLATVDQPGVDVRNGTAKIDLKLPRQGVALLVLTWKP